MKRGRARVARWIVSLLALGQSACLIADHVEMSGIEPPLPSDAELASFLAEPGGPSSIEWVQSGLQVRDSGGTSTTGGARLEWPNGDVFLIDLGMSDEGMRAFGALMETFMGAEPVEVFGSIGSQLGTEADRVVGIGLTHLHEDHTEGAGELCSARTREDAILLHQTADQATRRNGMTEDGAVYIESADCLSSSPFSESGSGRLFRVPGLTGLAAFPVGGHTPGSTVFVVRDGDRLVLFAGDITNVHQHLIDNVSKGWLYSTFLVPENTGRMEQLRVWLAGLHARDDMDVVISHDPEALRAGRVPVRGAP